MRGGPEGECRLGTVVSAEDGFARVQVQKVSCAGCEIAGACLASMDGGQDYVVARDPIGVAPGDRVEIGISAASEVKIACTLYLVPAICLTLGVAAGGWGAGQLGLDPTTGSLLIGLLSAALSLVPARRYARRIGVVPVVLRHEE
ncbi:MAG: SoxR reducing system RseC family protein [Pseudomonadota bacterium]